MLKTHTHTQYVQKYEGENVKLSGVTEAFGLGGDCFKSMLMETNEF